MPAPTGGITVVGSLNYDILFGVERLPKRGETLTASTMNFQGGGKGANQAMQAALLGAPVAMIGAVGDDPLGGFLRGQLDRAGVDCSLISVVEEPTGVGVVSFVSDGSVAATIGRGANYALTVEDVHRGAALFERSKVVLLQLENPIEVVAAAAERGRQTGNRVVLNAAPATDLPARLIQQVDILVVNEVEAAFYLDGVDTVGATNAANAVLKLSDRFGAEVVVTLGADGSYVTAGTGLTEFIPAQPVTAVETTGAGDSFIGAMSVALIEGKTLTQAAEYGTLAASITVQSIGAQGSMPDRGAIEAHT